MADLPTDISARVRAARGYAGLTRDQVAERTDISARTQARIEEEGRHPKQSELWSLAEVCGVPREWFTQPLGRGTDGAGSDGQVIEQLGQLERGVTESLRRLEVMVGRIVEIQDPQWLAERLEALEAAEAADPRQSQSSAPPTEEPRRAGENP